MATTKKAPQKKKVTKQQLIDAYMHYVLEHEKAPLSIYKFVKEHGFTEQGFYAHFGSFESLKSGIWTTFFEMTMDLAHKNKDYESFSNREKMLTFFYTFFELLSANRSYVLVALNQDSDKLKTMQQLAPLRKKIKSLVNDLIKEKNDEQQLKFLKQPGIVFSEGAWLQFVFILKFWMDDNSPSFEKTDMVIEKSVRAIFDVFATTPLESVVDFGKFLWKEKMA